MNNAYAHVRRFQEPSRRTLSIVSKVRNPEIQTITHIGTTGLNNQFLHSRRQNYLNTGYNIRKQKLQDITKQNRKIYDKINYQKSAYSRKQLRKSYQSNASLSRRLSQSKISRRSMNSQTSIRSSQVKKGKITLKNKKQQYKIETRSIETIKHDDISKFCKVLKPSTTNIQISSRARKQSFSTKTTNSQTKVFLPPIKKSIQRKKASTKSQMQFNDGTFLHIIAEEMFGKQKNRN